MALTENLNLMQPNTFQIVINRKNFGTSNHFAQSFVHPSVNIGYGEQLYGKINISQPGDKFEIGELRINFLVDEELRVYEELYRYMEYLRDNDLGHYGTLHNNDEFDHFNQITINILTNKNNIIRSIKYKNCIITDLGDINFEAMDGDQYLTIPASFKFTTFEVI